MSVMPAMSKGPATLLAEFLTRRDLSAPAERRPLYRYACAVEELASLEASLLDERHPFEQRMKLVPLVASESFRRRYREGPWSWDDCGETVAKFRRRAGMRFGPWLLDALSYWKLDVIRGDGMSHQYLETLVVNGGFPVAFVEGQSALRALLKRLIAEHVRSGKVAAEHRAELEIPVSRLPRAYRQSQDFKLLCVELAGAAAKLADGFDRKVNTLKQHLKRHSGWEAMLPFRLDSEAADQLLTELLETAHQAGVARPLDSAVCLRELLRSGDSWRLVTRLAPLPDSLDLGGSAPVVMKLGLSADGAAIRPLVSLSRQTSGRHLIRPRPAASLLVVPAPFDDPARSIGLVATAADQSLPLPVRDGDALEDSEPWVFVPQDSEGTHATCESWRFVSQGDVRTKDQCLLACVPQEAIVEGDDVADYGEIQLAAGHRRIVRVAGRAVVRCQQEAFEVHAGSNQDPTQLDLRGRQLSIRSPDAAMVFAGAPSVVVRDCVGDATIEWKASLGEGWSANVRDALGLVTYRARVDGTVVARRKALVLPADFKVHSTNAPEFRLAMSPGWFVSGISKPVRIDGSLGHWSVPATALPGSRSKASVMVRPPESVPKSIASIELCSHSSASGFREIVSGVEAPARTSLDRVGRYEACVSKQAGKLLFINWGSNATMPVVCEVDNGNAYSLQLSWIAEDLRDIDASRQDADGRIRVEIVDQGRAKTLEVAPVRLIRQAAHVVLDAGGEHFSTNIEVSARHFSLDECAQLEADPGRPGTWTIPDTLKPGWTLLTANRPSIRPLAVRIEGVSDVACETSISGLLQSSLPSGDRRRALRDHLTRIVATPLDENNAAEISFLSVWLERFRDVPGPYVDVVGSLLGEPETALRLLAYYGASSAHPLAERAVETPLWWHLVPTKAWGSLANWWADGVDPRSSGGHAVNPNLFDGVVNAFSDSLHISEEDRSVLSTVLQFAVVSRKLKAGQKAFFVQPFKDNFDGLTMQWSQCLAGAVDGGALLPPLPNLQSINDKVRQLLPHAMPRQSDPNRTPYLLAPIACAVAAELGVAEQSLRHELVRVRRFDRSLFDSLYTNIRIQLACT